MTWRILAYNYCTIFLWFFFALPPTLVQDSYDFFTTSYLQLARNFPNAYEFLAAFLKPLPRSYEFLITLFWVSHHFLMTFLWISCNISGSNLCSGAGQVGRYFFDLNFDLCYPCSTLTKIHVLYLIWNIYFISVGD